MHPVLTKHDFVRRYNAGEFGNHSPTWTTLRDFLRAGYRGLVHVRSKVAGAPTFYDVQDCDVPRVWNNAHWDYPGQWYLSAMCPTERTTIQGEVSLLAAGLTLRYSTVVAPMREALAKNQHHVQGIIANGLLRKYLCPTSYDWMMYLLSAYPDHVVEFTALSTNWGTVPGVNTLIWEVRAY
jgi:hypothetical protein